MRGQVTANHADCMSEQWREFCSAGVAAMAGIPMRDRPPKAGAVLSTKRWGFRSAGRTPFSVNLDGYTGGG